MLNRGISTCAFLYPNSIIFTLSKIIWTASGFSVLIYQSLMIFSDFHMFSPDFYPNFAHVKILKSKGLNMICIYGICTCSNIYFKKGISTCFLKLFAKSNLPCVFHMC